MTKDSRPYLSVVIPVFNEEEVLPVLLGEIYNVLNSLGKDYEIIFVDDGSKDQTPHILKQFADKDHRVKFLRFSRNFGHQAAFSAGIDASSGQYVLTMDGDLQHPPRLIPEFIKHAEDGFDMIIGERLQNKQNSFIREFTGRMFYKILSTITNLEFKNASDFALYSNKVVKVLRKLPERERFLRGLVQWVGFKKKYLPYVVEARRHGKAKYTIKKLTGLIMSGVTSFSPFPLRISFWLGMIVFLVSIGLGIFVVLDHYFNPNPFAAGYATVSMIVLFLGSIQLIMLGISGEYLYKMFNEIKGRPLYIIAETLNIDNQKIEKTPYGIYIE